ncbi:MAG: hypothetical protein ABI591_31625 [Kofleriaceae bacterium]
MRVVGAVLCLVGACGFTPNAAGTNGDDGGVVTGDGTVQHDAAVPNCFGKGMLQVCFDSLLPGTFTAPPSGTLATDTDANCTKVYTQPGGRELCVVAAQTLDIAIDLRAIGNRPLVLIGAATLTVESGITIDMASRDGSNAGAGGNDSACVAPSVPQADTGGGGGGAGGSFFGKGGDGGIGDGNNNSGGDGTADPGLATAAVTPTIVRGGCKGGIAGGDAPGDMGKVGGNSGGAIYLIAGTHLTIAGTIDAGGAGGQASDTLQGGPGAGSGGMIGFDAPMIDFTGGAFANGGGGAEGGSNGTHGDGGNAGKDGVRSSTIAAAGGSGGTTDSGHGGDGSVGTSHDGAAGAVFDGGGGGGGGGAGYLYVFGTFGTNTGQRSPS